MPVTSRLPITVEETTYNQELYWTKAKRGADRPPRTAGRVCTIRKGAVTLLLHREQSGMTHTLRVVSGCVHPQNNGVTWSTPSKVVGEDGADGVDGKYTDYQLQRIRPSQKLQQVVGQMLLPL